MLRKAGELASGAFTESPLGFTLELFSALSPFNSTFQEPAFAISLPSSAPVPSTLLNSSLSIHPQYYKPRIPSPSPLEFPRSR